MSEETLLALASRAYPNVAAGEEVMPDMRDYRMSCCDCGLVHTMNFHIVKIVGQTGGVFHAERAADDSLRVILSADRDDDETDRNRAARGLSEAPELDLLLERMLGHYPIVAIAHAINRAAPGLREVLARAALDLVASSPPQPEPPR